MITAGLHASPATLRGQDDERLVALAVAGNEAAFDALVARYRQPLWLYCSRMLPSDRAEDVVQEALLSTYAVLRSGRAPARLRPWLFQVAHNAAVDALRSRQPAPVELDPEVGDVRGQEGLIETRDTTREVFAAVTALPDRQRDAIVLRELEGRSYDDIGRRLGASTSAVRQLIVRARQSVRAAAAAVAPAGLLTRFPWLGNSVAGHSAELSAGAGVSAATAQVWVTALVTCTMGGSVVMLAKDDGPAAPAAPATDTSAVAAGAGPSVASQPAAPAGETSQVELRRTITAAKEQAAAGTGAHRAEGPAKAPEQSGVAVPPLPPGCAAPEASPPAGSARRRRAQRRRRAGRSCDSGPLAVGNAGPNDAPQEVVPESEVISLTGPGPQNAAPPAEQESAPAEEPAPPSGPESPDSAPEGASESDVPAQPAPAPPEAE